MSDSDFQARPRAPIVLLGLAAAIVGVHLYVSSLSADGQNEIFDQFALIPARFSESSVYHFNAAYEAIGALLGHAFLHAGWFHLGMNMLMLWMVSPWLAFRLGPALYLMLFVVSTLGGAAAYLLINAGGEQPAVGASGAVCGLFGAYFLSVRPTLRQALADQQVRGSIMSFLFINVVLAGVASATGFLPIAWEAHLGGFIAGVLFYLLIVRLSQRRATGPWG